MLNMLLPCSERAPAKEVLRRQENTVGSDSSVKPTLWPGFQFFPETTGWAKDIAVASQNILMFN